MSVRKNWQRNSQRSAINRSSSAKETTKGSRKIRIAVKFCGSCNPEIDLSPFAWHMKQFIASREDIELVPFDSPDIDLAIILCGCLRACAYNEEIKEQPKRRIIIAGESLNGTHYLEKQLPHILTAEIERKYPPLR